MKPDFLHEFVPGNSDRTLLLLHGTGGNERDLIPLGRDPDSNASSLSPRGKVLENGMPRFFRRLAEGVFDLEDLRKRTQELADFRGFSGRNGTRSTSRRSLRSAIPMAQTLPRACFCFVQKFCPLRFYFERWCHWFQRRCQIFLPRAYGLERDHPIQSFRYPKQKNSRSFCERPESMSPFVSSKSGHELTPDDVDAAREWLRRLP